MDSHLPIDEQNDTPSKDLRISPNRVTTLFLLFSLALVAAGVVTNILRFSLGFDPISMLDLDHEANLPSWFTSLLLAANAGLLVLITLATAARRAGSRVLYWGGLAFIFFLLSFDETAAIHERSITPLRTALDLTGVLYYSWVIPAAICVAIFCLTYASFLFSLPRRTAGLFILAGATYVGGALGLELVGGAYVSAVGLDFSYAMITSTEEALELFGLTIFLFALLDYLRLEFGKLTLDFGG